MNTVMTLLNTLMSWLMAARPVRRPARLRAASDHTAQIIWLVIIVVLGLLAYVFFGNNGPGGQWFNNMISGVTRFKE